MGSVYLFPMGRGRRMAPGEGPQFLPRNRNPSPDLHLAMLTHRQEQIDLFRMGEVKRASCSRASKSKSKSLHPIFDLNAKYSSWSRSRRLSGRFRDHQAGSGAAAPSSVLRCSTAAVRLLRRCLNRMSDSSLPARRRNASRIVSCSRIASPQRSRLRAKLAE